MMAWGHSCTGVPIGTGAATALILIPAQLVGQPLPVPAALTVLVLGGIAGAGAALWPDWDEDGTVVYNCAGPISAVIGELLQALSMLVYRSTSRRCDHWDTGRHRFLLHSPTGALITGVVSGGLAHSVPWAGYIVLWFLLAPGIRALASGLHHQGEIRTSSILRSVAGAALVATILCLAIAFTAAGYVVFEHGPQVPPEMVLASAAYAVPWPIGMIVTAGMLTHDAGDSATNSGVPWKGLFAHRCDRHRAEYLRTACSWRVRVPWHDCARCATARRRYPRCARWDRNHIVPARWRFSTGTPEGMHKEHRLAVRFLLIGLIPVLLMIWPLAQDLIDTGRALAE